MNRSSLGVAVLLIVFCAAGCTGKRGSGVLKKETREVAVFSKVKASGAFKLDITIGEPKPVELSGDDNLLPHVQAEVKDGCLTLSTRGNVRPKLPLTATISTKTLALVGVSGACRVTARGLTGESFRLEISGAGSSTLQGKVDKFSIELSGAGRVKAEKLLAREVKVLASGAGKAEVRATEALDVVLSGVGKVVYHGDPKKVTQNISGVGKLVKK